MRVLLVDDHPLFLGGLQNLLQGRGFDVVGVAGDGCEALREVRSLVARGRAPDMILMDIRMPECDGLAGTRLIKAEFPAIRIVMLTMSADDDDIFDALRLGADGYLLKSQEMESFFRSLGELGQGEVVLAPGLARRLVAEFGRLQARDSQARDAQARDVLARGARAGGAGGARGGGLEPQEAPRLSPRQAQILSLVARELTYKEIGSELGLTERTIKYHMGEILALLHLASRAEAEAYARERRI